MIRANNFSKRKLGCVAAASLLAGWLTASALAQSSNHGIVTDASSDRLIFSDPGTLEDAIKNGTREKWERIVNDPRYRMQQMRRGLPMAGQTATATAALPRAQEVASVNSNVSRLPLGGNPLNTDWPFGVPLGLKGTEIRNNVRPPAPAKASLSPNGTPSCEDYVVFPVPLAGAFGSRNGKANLVIVNDMYASLCPAGGVPTVMAAYFVGPGAIYTSPVISIDEDKVAFVESRPGGNGGLGSSIFHVLTLDLTTGNAGCPFSPCNGEDFEHPVAPCMLSVDGSTPAPNPLCPELLNAAVDTQITLFDNHGGAATSTHPGTTGGCIHCTLTGASALWLDYATDTAFIVSDDGLIHKIRGVFNGTPTEVPEEVDGFPSPGNAWGNFSPQRGLNLFLSSPVVDPVSRRLFFGTTGTFDAIYRCSADGGHCDIFEAPFPIGLALSTAHVKPVAITSLVVDSSAGLVFTVFRNGDVDQSIFLAQTRTNFLSNGPVGKVPIGFVNLSPGLAFDEAVFGVTRSVLPPLLYTCGTDSSANHHAALMEFGFHDGTFGRLTLNGTPTEVIKLTSGNTGGICSRPLDLVGVDTVERLFVAVNDNCEGHAHTSCLLSFKSNPDGTFVLPGHSMQFPNPGFGGPPATPFNPISDMIIDNLSSGGNIYFELPNDLTGRQVSQRF